jgi:hypothetical protein
MSVRLSDLGGELLRMAFRGIHLLRRPRPIHPHGVSLTGTLRWDAEGFPAGIEWIDRLPEGGTQTLRARLSRSVGLPSPLPDVLGLALRFETAAGPADLELASTGFGFPSRFWLAPQRSPSRARLTTLFPYQGSRGPVLIGARTLSPQSLPTEASDLAVALTAAPWRLRLYHAAPRGLWHPFATLELVHEPGPLDTGLRFDAVRHPLPGAGVYAWSARLREPSYRLVQADPVQANPGA